MQKKKKAKKCNAKASFTSFVIFYDIDAVKKKKKAVDF